MGFGAIFRLGIPIALGASSGVAMDQINLLITSSTSDTHRATRSLATCKEPSQIAFATVLTLKGTTHRASAS